MFELRLRLVLGISLAAYISVVVPQGTDVNTMQKTAQKWYQTHRRLSSLAADAQAQGKCSANTNESFSWFLLNSLFQRSEELNQGLLRTAWTRIDFYNEHLPLLYNSNATFCKHSDFWNSEWTLVGCFVFTLIGAETTYITQCRQCIDPDISKYAETNLDLQDVCGVEERLPPENKLKEREVKAIEDLRKEYRKPLNVSDSNFTIDFGEFWAFRQILKEKSRTLEDFELCDDSLELTMSLGYMYAMLDAEVRNADGTENEESTKSELQKQWDQDKDLIQEKLKWLKGAEEKDISCKWGQFCGPDAVCIDCKSVVFPIEYEDICGSKQKIRGNWEHGFTYEYTTTTIATTEMVKTTAPPTTTTTKRTSGKGVGIHGYGIVILISSIVVNTM